MPRENRKRGKKHKKSAADEDTQGYAPPHIDEPIQEAGPSWITPAPAKSAQEDREAPFGYVDSEVKAYFRTVDVQIREWQDEHELPEGQDSDPNEDRRLFFAAALNEMSDKEKQLATDPDCSGILERMAYSMDDFARRVFMDRLSGSYEELFKHRFASHVCQTFLTVAGDTIAREYRGVLPSSPENEDSGELRTLSQLVEDLCEEIIPVVSSLVLDSFASHVVRALLSLLAPSLDPQSQHGQSNIRSKKSAAFKAKQGPLKSVFTANDPAATAAGTSLRPDKFKELIRRFVVDIRTKLGENEIRALAASQVASPVLKMLLEAEAEENMADEPGSLMDTVLAGLVSALHANGNAKPDASDYVGTLLRDPTSSHLLETLVSRSPPKVFDVLWATYFQGKLGRLAAHPVANFVVAKALLRLEASQLAEACDELNPAATKILKSSRVGIFRALVDRAASLHCEEAAVLQTIVTAFGIDNDEDRKQLVACVLRLLPIQEYRLIQGKEETQDPGPSHGKQRSQKKAEDPSEPKTQGALLLQSLLSLPAPHNQAVIDSISSNSLEELLAMSSHVTSSRVFDALLDSPAVPIKAKRQFVLKFLGHFHILVDDRIGSRVGDRCWAYADPYLKEKIARSLIPHEQFLAGSFYGKFFARRLNLQLLRKDTEKWKSMQSSSKPPPPASATKTAEASLPDAGQSTRDDKRKRKRPGKEGDEIDQLFNTALGKKTKKAGITQTVDEAAEESARAGAAEQDEKQTAPKTGHDKALDDVLGAIQAAPKSEVRSKKKKRVK
ncbi:Nucleolar protein 9 [Steccherinum ochraceum]|uniref:Nucleolar protein 9 n=1 Tax=Steccherinum ochraceum TaxID=92696 RepID=A0A4R0RTB8_9APHY|nr:Nucleolar protein 9 [Steccherinum ochraceum]